MICHESNIKIDRKHRSSISIERDLEHDSKLQILFSDLLLSANLTPANLTAEIIDETTVALDWDDLPSEYDSLDTSFRVYVKNTVSGEIEQQIDGIQLSEAEVMGLTELEQYEFWVFTMVGDYESAESDHVFATPEQQQADAPQNFDVEVKSNTTSLSFDGVNDYVVADQPFDGVGDFTVEVLIKTTTGSLGNFVAIRQSSVGTGQPTKLLTTRINNGNLNLLLRNSAGTVNDLNTADTYNNGAWYRAVFSRQGSTLSIRILDSDSNIVETVSMQGVSDDVVDANSKLILGTYESNNSSEYYEGLMDDIRFWNVYRTDQEIIENNKSLLKGDESGLNYYADCEDQGSQLTDLTANNNHGTINGAAYSNETTNWINALCTWDEVQGVDGYNVYLKRPDYALGFDGNDDWVDLDAHAGNFPQGTNARTIEGEFDADNTVGQRWFSYGVITVDSSDAGKRVSITATGDSIAVAVQGHNYGVTGLGLSGIHHVAVVFPDGATMSDEFLLYLDGNLLNPTDLAGSPQSVDTVDEHARIGTSHGQAAYYNGTVDNLRIWNVERSQQQINDNIGEILTGNETGLVAYYPMNEGQGSTLVDHAGGNDGVINGASWTIVGSLDFEKENTSLIPTPEYTIEDLPDGEYEAYCTAVDNQTGESDPSNIEVFIV